MEAHSCPVCIGRGIVQQGFYDQFDYTYITTITFGTEMCRSCSGTGVVYSGILSQNLLKDMAHEIEGGCTRSCHRHQMNTYRKTATVQAKLFEPGDEDGIGEDGRPFVTTLENQNGFVGDFYKNYICTGINGERWLVERSIFEKTYELV